MSDASDELRDVAAHLRTIRKQADDAAFKEPLSKLEVATNQVLRAWSGSNIGYHACVYHADMATPPPGEHFSREWGFGGMFGSDPGPWVEYDFDEARDQIQHMAGDPELVEPERVAGELFAAVDDARATIESILTSWLARHDDDFVNGLLEKTSAVKMINATNATMQQLPSSPVATRDPVAGDQGLRPAPHQALIGFIRACRSPVSASDRLATIAERAASHIDRGERNDKRAERSVGSCVFIGHGRSLQWRELKDFIQDRLGLPWDEFNRVPVAGVTNIERLVEMMDQAAIALLVLTAEDEQADGTVTARQNVVHEAGLFQGRLGFTKAIVLLEDGCEEFSNINGLGQIRYPAGDIGATFEEVRQVMEREDLF